MENNVINIDNDYNYDNECIFCLENLQKKDQCKISCGHVYHYECVIEWIKTTNKITKLCPVCNIDGEIINIISNNNNNYINNSINNNINSEINNNINDEYIDIPVPYEETQPRTKWLCCTIL